MPDRQTKLVLTAAAVAAALAGCEVGPNYHPPTTTMPANYSESDPRASSLTTQPGTQPATADADNEGTSNAPAPDLQRWWKTFNDPTLDALIDRAVHTNLDLQLARARVQEARALLRGNRANLLPTLGNNSSFARERFSRGSINNNSLSSINGSTLGGTGTTNTFTPGTKRDVNLFDTDFDAAWEIDVFGGQRRAIESSGASEQATLYNLQNTQITLIAEVALNYANLRGAQRQLDVAKQNIRSQSDAVALTQQRRRAGLTSELDVARAEATLATTETSVPPLEATEHMSIHAISVLLGMEPGALLNELLTPGPIPPPPPDVPVGLPSELLRRRPDVRLAERDLAAATANIGVAVADYYPRFTINGTAGFSASQAGNWFNKNSFFYQFGPKMTWTLFDFGRIAANIDVQKARQAESFIQYNQTVLAALQQTEDSLITYNRERVRRDKLAQAVAANQRSVDLSLELYRRGLDTFLDVITAEQSLFVTQDQLAQSQRLVATDLISLYKNLGGGWDPGVPVK